MVTSTWLPRIMANDSELENSDEPGIMVTWQHISVQKHKKKERQHISKIAMHTKKERGGVTVTDKRRM